jgi:hypothetical protein
MNFSDMQKGRFSAVQPSVPISNENPDGTQPVRIPHTPPYEKGECDPRLIEQPQVYTLHAKRYAAKYSIKIALNLDSALTERQKGEITLTMREVDTAARLKIPLDKDFIRKALQAIHGMIVEGIPGEPENPYHLRAFYNRGIKFKKATHGKSDYERVPPAKQERADAAMKEILAKLEAHNLPAWPEEIENGFPQELCKPEYMTWDQFNKAQAQTLHRYNSGYHGENSYEPDTAPITGTQPVIPIDDPSFSDGTEPTEHSHSPGV